ncbi:MAG: SurA N-terminal domain-containing protein [Paludibacteraceae bacterium]|nr:SurA N-terminal domain-containing protein [Paludibacteraceae bacterium]
MATLEKIRQKGLLLSIVIGVAMLLFIIGMVDFNSIFGSSRQNVAEVDGDEITIAEYEKKIDEMTSFYKLEMRSNSLTDQQTEQIRSSVWSSFLRERVIGKQCQKLGIVVSDEELEESLTGEIPNPMLMQLGLFYNPEKGGFDAEIVRQVADAAAADETSDVAKYWNFVKNSIKNQMLEEKYNALVGASININNLDAQYAFNAQKGADIEFTSTPLSTVADSLINTTSKDIKAYYSANKNTYYRDNESREIEYLTFDIVPSENDYADIKAWIEDLQKEFYTSDDFIALSNQNSDESYNGVAQSLTSVDSDLKDFAKSGKAGDAFGPQLFGDTYKMARIVEKGIIAPDSAKVSHILVMESSKERTEQVADSLIAAINGGSDFAEVAKAFSKAGTSANGGELGWLKDGDFDKEFSSACINAPIGKLVKYNMNGGIQIIKVTEKTKPVEKIRMCVLSRKVEASSQTYGQIFNQASQYMAQNSSIDKFETSADAAQGQFLRNYSVAVSDVRISDLKDSRQIVRWAYEAKKGDVADRVFECGDKFVVAALKSVSKKGYPEISEIEETLTTAVKNEKKADMIADNISAKLAEGLAATGEVKTAQGVSFNSQYVNGIGMEPKLYATVANMTPESAPAVVKGNYSVYAVKVVSTNETGEFNAQAEISQLENRRPYKYMIYNALEKGAEINDNRITFY